MKKQNTFTAKQIAIALNNLLLQTLSPASSGPIPERRLRKLRAYAEAGCEPFWEHLDQDLLRPEELVMVFVAEALLTHQKYVVKSDKLPLGSVAEQITGKGGASGK